MPIRKPRNNADECHCAETQRDGGFPGDLLCRAARPWGLPRASRRFAHLIPESLRRGHAGLIQRFLKRGAIRQPLGKLTSYNEIRPTPIPASCRFADSWRAFVGAPAMMRAF